jgi:hypothetical protein
MEAIVEALYEQEVCQNWLCGNFRIFLADISGVQDELG